MRLPNVQTDESGEVTVASRLETILNPGPASLRRPTRLAAAEGQPAEMFYPPGALPPEMIAPDGEWIASPDDIPIEGLLVPPGLAYPDGMAVPPQGVGSQEWLEGQPFPRAEPFPSWEDDALEASPASEARFGHLLKRFHESHCVQCGPLAPIFVHDVNPYPDAGFGVERVAFAPFFIDISQPQRMFRLRFDAVYDLTLPDRAEAFWARPRNLSGGKGPPAPEVAVSYQDFAFAWETGTEFFSVTTNIPVRVLDPVINFNTAGLSDISIKTKLRLLDGDHWQITQVMTTYVPSGAFGKGLGAGHTSLEPGILCRYRINPATYLHGEGKYWFSVGGDPAHQGQILQWGVGISHILYEHDTFALMPTLEFIHMSFLDGQKAVFPPLAAVDIDDEAVFNLHPGMRMAVDTGRDLGVMELGVASGVGLGSVGWWDQMLRVDLRWAY